MAIWLLLGITSYVTILTVTKIPMPYSNPVFILAGAVLTASTAACAWERTGAARRSSPSGVAGPADPVRRTAAASALSVPLPEGVSSAQARRRAESAFADTGLRTVVGEDAVVGWSNSWARWASPVFHWALVALFVLAALGQLMRAEGLMNVVVGGSMTDSAASYAPGSPNGPLFFGRYTGARIGVEALTLDLKAGGSGRGDSPLVTISAGGREVARTYVYPNSPASWGPLTIHRDATGPALLVAFRFPNGQVETSVPVFLAPAEADTTASAATASVDFVRTGTGQRTVVEVEPRAGKRVVLRIRAVSFESPPVAAGETVRLPDGTDMTVVALTTYARLRVVNDWTIPFVFAAFVLIVFAPMNSILWPPRRALAYVVSGGVVVEGDQEVGHDAILEVRVSQRRSDPAFRGRLRTAVTERVAGLQGSGAAEGRPDETEDTS